MEKSTMYNHNSESTPSAPPSYEQATDFTDYSSPANQQIGQPRIHHNAIPDSRNIRSNVITQGPQTVPLVIQHQDRSQPISQQPVVIVQQQSALPLLLNAEPIYIRCPACNVGNVTRIERAPSSVAPIISCMLCILGCWCCVCLPYVCDTCMNAKHYCSNCNQYLGTFDVHTGRRTN